MRHLILCATLAVTLFLAGCGVAVPSDKQAYVGEWQSHGMAVNITQNGRVVVVKEKDGSKTRVEAPLQGFSGNDFIVGLGPMKTTYKVSAPPHQVDGQWRMTVDGVELTRVGE